MTQSQTTIHLIRHGEVKNPQGVFYGRLPRFPLCAEGRAQALAASTLLARERVVAIFSSPMLRARQTAAVIAAAHPGLRVRQSKLLHEVWVPIDGLPLEEGIRRNWDIYTGNPPPYEQPEHILNRMLRFVSQCRSRYGGQTVAAITHGDPIGFLMLWAWGEPVTAERKAPLYGMYLEVASITTLVFRSADPADRPAVLYTPAGAAALSQVETRSE